MPIETLRTEISELQTQITYWENEIEVISHSIDCARNDIEAKEAEIARLEAEAQRGDLITQLTEALANMSIDQLTGLVSSLQNGETPTIQPAATTTHGPTVTVEIPVPEEPENPCWLTSDQFDELEFLPGDMREADCTIVGVRHQDLFRLNNYVPQIGELVRLEKETATSNCYGVLISSEINGLEEDMAIGILPTNGGAKEQELRENDLPCVCHQAMWENPDLDELYEITGVIVGRYVTIRKVESITPVTEEEVETVEEESSIDSTLLDLRTLVGTASTIAEARNVFSNEMSNQCTIRRDLDAPIQEITNGFIVYYDDHRHNEMENVHQAILVSKPE